MIIRIVKLKFKPEEVENFKAYFEQINSKIRQFPGCNHLELWQDIEDEQTFFTYSHWDAQEDLNVYRDSSLFKEFWSVAKPKFAEKAQAWSHQQLVVAP